MIDGGLRWLQAAIMQRPVLLALILMMAMIFGILLIRPSLTPTPRDYELERSVPLSSTLGHD